MMRRIVLLVCTVMVLVSGAQASTPKTINVQGRLTDTAGDPLPAGPKTMQFRIFDAEAAGAQIWPGGGFESQVITTSTEGLWTALLGAIAPLHDSVFSDTTRWLEITVDDGANPVTTLPRVRLVTGPFAFRVATVDGAAGGTITSKVSIGSGHTNNGANAFIAGANNTADGDNAVISGGTNNNAAGLISVIAGGSDNTASFLNSTVGGGGTNTAGAIAATVSGGVNNQASGEFATIGGGTRGTARGAYSTIAGGGGPFDSDTNSATGYAASIGGGSGNVATGMQSTIAGGAGNQALSMYSGALSGSYNRVEAGSENVIAGGNGNVINSGGASAVGGGFYNSNSSTYGVIAGGNNNTADAPQRAVIGGGGFNRAGGWYSVVGGGGRDTTLGYASTVPGGAYNTAAGDFSFAAGRNAKASHHGSFVWADSAGGSSFSSTGVDQFLIRSAGGVGVNTNTPYTDLTLAGTGSIGFKNGAAPMMYMYETGTTNTARPVISHSPSFPDWGLGYADSGDEFTFQAGGFPALAITLSASSPRVGVGVSSPSNILQVKQNSTTDPVADAWTTYSSRRWKTNIATIEDALEKVEHLRGVEYDAKATGKHEIGLIAEEVGDVIPEIVQYEDNGVDAQSIEYARLVALLIEAVKEQQRRIDRLEATIQASHIPQQTSAATGD